MEVIKVYRADCGDGFVAFKEPRGVLDEVAEFIDGDEIGSELRLVKAEMTEEEYNKLPEFQGW